MFAWNVEPVAERACVHVCVCVCVHFYLCDMQGTSFLLKDGKLANISKVKRMSKFSVSVVKYEPSTH